MMCNIQIYHTHEKIVGKLKNKSHKVNRNDLIVGWILSDYFYSII